MERNGRVNIRNTTLKRLKKKLLERERQTGKGVGAGGECGAIKLVGAKQLRVAWSVDAHALRYCHPVLGREAVKVDGEKIRKCFY
jgi:hypothetical protein